MVRQAGHSHSDRDKIYTPPHIAQMLVNKIPAAPGDSWCDPCYGDGAFFNCFPQDSYRDFYEIDMGRDFLKAYDYFDWQVTNIPFSRPKEFIFKMADMCNKGMGILCLANSMTATRILLLQDMGLYMHSCTTLYIREWGFGYRTDFYIFTHECMPHLEVLTY